MARAPSNIVYLESPEKGVDGRGWISAARDPIISDGRIGDMWFNTLTHFGFGPKTAGGWGVGTYLRGPNGWTALTRVVADGTRRVREIYDWIGGEGTKPATGYEGATGTVPDIEDAVDYRGAEGPQSLINTLDPKADAVTYETMTALAEAASDNEKAPIKRVFEAGGSMAFRTKADAQLTEIPASVVRTVVEGLSYVRSPSEATHNLKYRSADRWTDAGDHDSANGGWHVLDEASIYPESGGGADAASLQKAIDARRNIRGRAGTSYGLTGIELGHSASFDGGGALVTATAGNAVFKMAGFGGRIGDVYNSDNRLSEDYFLKIAPTDGNVAFWRIHDIDMAVGGPGGISLEGSATYHVQKGQVARVNATGFTGTGLFMGSSVNTCDFNGVRLQGKAEYIADKGRPSAGSVGYRINTPLVGGIVTGGHVWTGCSAETFDKGWWFTDAQLHEISNCFVDGVRDYGLRIDGASHDIEIHGFFCGVSMGVYIGGTSQKITLNGLKTSFTGQTPVWGQNPWYNTAGPFYDVTVADAAQVTIDGNSWRGGKKVSVAAGAKLIVTGGEWFRGRSVTSVASGSTVYLPEYGQQSTEASTTWRAPYDGYLFMLRPLCTAAPGVGESFTYTVRKGFVDTALTAQISGAGVFVARSYAAIAVSEGEQISIKLATSAGAAAAQHSVSVQMLPL